MSLTRREFLAITVPAAVGTAMFGFNQGRNDAISEAPVNPEELAERILAVTWEDIDNPRTHRHLAEMGADTYRLLTASTIRKDRLVSHAHFYRRRDEFTRVVQARWPLGYSRGVSDSEVAITVIKRGAHNFGHVSMDLSKMREQKLSKVQHPGLALVEQLTHEHGHVDIEDRFVGQYINSNNNPFSNSTVLMDDSVWIRYFGGTLFTARWDHLIHSDEIWLQTATHRLFQEGQLAPFLPKDELDLILNDSMYYRNGVELLRPLTIAADLNAQQVFQMRRVSDLERFARAIGGVLPPGDGYNMPRDSLYEGFQILRALDGIDESLLRDKLQLQCLTA